MKSAPAFEFKNVNIERSYLSKDLLKSKECILDFT